MPDPIGSPIRRASGTGQLTAEVGAVADPEEAGYPRCCGVGMASR